MLSLLYLQNGFFIKPKEMEFDPHARVGSLLVDPQSMEVLAKYRKFLCKCYRDERVFIDREIIMTSVNVKSGLGLFRYMDFLPPTLESFLNLDSIKRISKRLDILELLHSLNELIEKSETGEMSLGTWISMFDSDLLVDLLTFAHIYDRIYTEVFDFNLEVLRKKTPAIAYRIYELIGSL